MTRAPDTPRQRTGEEGYLLLGLVVACFLLLLALSVAAPRVAKELERDREVESEHRALEYVRAIQLYYKKNNAYPTSVEQLLGSSTSGGTVSIGPAGNIKYLRQKYKDPLTNDEFRLIHAGEAKTEVKGFFGEPLQGMPVGNLGSVQGMVSNLNTTAAGTFGGSSATGAPATATAGGSSSSAGASASSTGTGSTSFGSSAFNNSGTGTSPGATGTGGTTGTASAGNTGSGSGGNDATTFQGSKGAFIGVASNAKGHGLVEWNGSENIEDWEFLYDPRVEILKAKVSLFGGGPPTVGAGSGNSLGSGFGSPTGGSTGLTTTGLGGTSTGIGGATGTTGTSTPGTGTTGTSTTGTPTVP